ncbi:unnamed protein product [Protopolystoma xenopodis]|uniref:Uncharacterized protein n=1 Tax=Protopolystoma xenopodis TaxID=117903 RepID=A0A3S5FGA5_9PLAT|nr:unnamed protein product [Protopolystoma xenopodis]
MDTNRSEIAELIARRGHEIFSKSSEKLAAYGENTRKRKFREAIDILTERNLMNRRLEEGVISENFAYCTNKLGDDQARARLAKRRRLDQRNILHFRKRDRKETRKEQSEAKRRRLQ